MTFRRFIPTGLRRAKIRFLQAALPIAGFVLFVSIPASAHHLGAAHIGPAKGLSIPNLTHGQMSVIAANRSAILQLAAAKTPTDPTMRRLEGYISIQFFACLWGLAPGGVNDDASPFNECSHAYLAGTRALLLHLLTMPGDRTAVRALVDKIEMEMLANGASLVLCRYSDERFDTAEIIGPRWSEIPFHRASLFSLAGLTLATAGCVWLALRRKRACA
jgi:hypothetical protein